MNTKTTTLHWTKRFPEWEQPTAVQVDQTDYYDDGETTTDIKVWLSAPRVAVTEIPLSHAMTVNEARALAQGLLAAVALVESMLPGRCTDCQEPIDDGERCLLCQMAAAKASRPKLTIV